MAIAGGGLHRQLLRGWAGCGRPLLPTAQHRGRVWRVWRQVQFWHLHPQSKAFQQPHFRYLCTLPLQKAPNLLSRTVLNCSLRDLERHISIQYCLRLALQHGILLAGKFMVSALVTQVLSHQAAWALLTCKATLLRRLQRAWASTPARSCCAVSTLPPPQPAICSW